MHGQVMMDGKKKHFCELVNLQIVVVFFANTYNAPMAKVYAFILITVPIYSSSPLVENNCRK